METTTKLTEREIAFNELLNSINNSSLSKQEKLTIIISLSKYITSL